MTEPDRDAAERRNGRSVERIDVPPNSFVERICLLVLLALIPLRAVIAESHTFEVPRFLRHVDVPEGPLPATTFAIFTVILTIAVWLTAARWWRSANHPESQERKYASQPEAQARESYFFYRRTGIEVGAAILAAGMLISTLRAGQKHLALIGSLDFLGLLLYAITLRQLLTRPWRLRLTMCVILATGAIVVAKCAFQHWIETPDTIRYFEENRDELIRATPQEAASNQAGFLYDYEQRLRSGAVSGYFAHPNVLGSYLILIVMTGLAVLAARWSGRPRWSHLVPGLITLTAVIALAYSQSKGAMASCAAAILIFIIGVVLRRAWALHPRRAATLIWLAGIATVITLVVLLNARPEALGKSMLFRHFYWRGAAALIDDQGLLGIGAGNFGRLFTRYKDAACPEDVDDPHSWPVKAAVEWGVLGLTGMLLVFASVSCHLCKNGRNETAQDAPPVRIPPSAYRKLDAHPSPTGSIILWTGGVGAIVFAWWAYLISGAAGGYAVLVLHLPAIVWVIAFAGGSLESSDKSFADEPPQLVLPALLGGMLGFILHSGVDLAMFQGGAATTFFAMMAVALAARGSEASTSRPSIAMTPSSGNRTFRATAVIACVIGTASLAAVTLWLTLPSARLGAALRIARTTESPARWDEYVASAGNRSYRDAAEAYRLDSTAVVELLEEWTARVAALAHADEALRQADELEARDPDHSAVWRHRATLHYQRYVIGRDLTDLRNAITAMEQSITAYPTSPNRRMIIAELFERLAEATDSSDARRAAAEQLTLALQLDDARVYISKPHRLTPSHRSQIEERIARLNRLP